MNIVEAIGALRGEPKGGRLEGSGAVLAFVLAGNARFTVVSKKTGARYTFRVRVRTSEKGIPNLHFVQVLTGPDNGTDYEYLGTIFPGRPGTSFPFAKFVHGKKSRIGEGAPSAKAFAWFWGRLSKGLPVDEAEVWHLGRCGRCGRDLTVPESVACGLGPECRGMVA